ncbi:serine/threonine-protein kinase [Phormidium sp. CCY1219]|uniref:serine/threonine-protein kinase n=1 Tax=Phormidium sp. CCY1219 TaxID=2886104 RepID=UPI002D1E5100|nr:serine/threonine-protein kinase [Phormidium sp. CCY1219]MEB3831763.1 serine/threonine protein kinase [Phormidium sp. CCY1219]
MSYCLNPKCPHPTDPANGNRDACVHCGCQLLLQNRYRIIRPLGGGGFGKTFEVDDNGTTKVLKVLLQNHEKAVELFKQEADVLKRIRHPGIPRIEPDAYFTVTPPGETEPIHCLVMEKISGLNLREWMKKRGNRPVSQEQAVEWLKQMSEILEQVHQQQFFHRDIKPLNIMVRQTGHVVLIDFGAAREVTNTYFAKVGQGQNITGIVSPGYTPPEQANGKAVPQSDFYALGRTFVFLLTGKPPTAFSENPRTGKLVWRNSAPQISKTFGDIIDYLMAPFPGKRPQSAMAIVHCLAEIDLTPPNGLDGKEHHSHNGRGGTKGNYNTRNSYNTSRGLGTNGGKGSSYRHPYYLRHNTGGTRGTHQKTGGKKPWPLAIAIVLVALLSSQVYGYWRYGFFPANPVDLIANLPSSLFLKRSIKTFGPIQSLAIAPQPLRENEDLLFASGSYGAVRVWEVQTGKLVYNLSAHKDWVKALAISPDGGTLATGSADKTIRLWNLENGSRMLTIAGPGAHWGPVNALAFSPDGRILASASDDNTIKIWDLRSGTRLRTIQAGSPVNAIAFTPDGRRIASGASDKTVKIWDLASGARLLTLRAHAHPVLSVAISPDGNTLASGSSDNTIQVWNLRTGERKYQLAGDSSWVRSVAIGPQGKVLASSGGTIELWNLATGDRKHQFNGHSSYVSAIAISPDGNTLLSGSPDRTIKVWRVPSVTDSGESQEK